MPTFADIYGLRAPATANFNAVANAIDGSVTANWGGVTGGVANAYTLSPNPAWITDTQNAVRYFFFTPHATNNGASNLNISGLGNIPLRYKNKVLVGGELVQNVETVGVYDGSVIELLVHGFGWCNYTPTYGGTGSMTFGTVTTNVAQYQVHGNLAMIRVNATGTTGGVANVAITATVPFTPASSVSALAAYIYDPTTLQAGVAYVSGSTLFVHKFDGSNWGLGGGRNFAVAGLLAIT